MPINETGTAHSGISVARQPLKKDEHDDNNEHERLQQRFNDFLHAFRDREGLIERDRVIHVRREALLRFRHQLAARLARL